MPETKEKTEAKVKEKEIVDVEKDAVANLKNFTTIPNSNSEFCIYTYKSETETFNQIMKPHFFNSAASFLNPGDTIRVFHFSELKELDSYFEFMVLRVDKINRTVRVSQLSSANLGKRIVE